MGGREKGAESRELGVDGRGQGEDGIEGCVGLRRVWGGGRGQEWLEEGGDGAGMGRRRGERRRSWIGAGPREDMTCWGLGSKEEANAAAGVVNTGEEVRDGLGRKDVITVLTVSEVVA